VKPYELVFLVTLSTLLALAFLALLYYSLKSKRLRLTTVYLSGEPENVVSSITPSVASLYWGFMKKFAKSLYNVLVEKVHTGNIYDWFKFISCWLSVLLIVAVAVFLTALMGG